MQVAALLQSGEDAAVLDARGRPPYAVAANKDVRDAFRRFLAAAGESLGWYAEAAGIPSALTPEMEAQQAAKQVPPAPAILQSLVPTVCVPSPHDGPCCFCVQRPAEQPCIQSPTITLWLRRRRRRG